LKIGIRNKRKGKSKTVRHFFPSTFHFSSAGNTIESIIERCIIAIRMSAIENDTSSAMNTKEKLLNLLLREKELPAEMKTKIDERVAEFWEGITIDAGFFLHENLDDKKHTQEEVKALVQCVPGSLSRMCPLNGDHEYFDDDYDSEPEFLVLPIQSAVWDYEDGNAYNANKAVSFIPLLAEEGFKLNVGGEGMRGGLLCEIDDKNNVLQTVVEAGWDLDAGDWHDLDSVCLDVMKRLRKMDLLKKEDIKEYGLLECAMNSWTWAEQRFEYLVDWDPAAFKEICISELPWCVVQSVADGHFEGAFNAGIKYFPQHIGNLAFRYISGQKGKEYKDEAWELIEYCLDEADPNKILKKNQVTNLYPFVTAAEGSRCCLDMVYYLLRKDPSVLGSFDDNEKPSAPTDTVTGKRKHK
jgi:hypothetical protein